MSTNPKESIRTWLTQKAILTAEKYVSTSTISNFQTTGKLTPDEFVLAGDYLVQNFPSWKWISGDKSKIRSHLPVDKQYLKLVGVICHSPLTTEETYEWDDSKTDTKVNTVIEIMDEISEIELDDVGDDDDDDVDSLDDFDYEDKALKEDDQSVLLEDNIVKHRSYNMMITYDTYYSTPRVWFYGFDEDGIPLKGEEWHNDFSKDHLNKTVTFESHPHEGFSCPTIHPCKHDVSMLRVIKLASEHKKIIEINQYLFIFLKLIQAMVPNMEYDFTGSFDM